METIVETTVEFALSSPARSALLKRGKLELFRWADLTRMADLDRDAYGADRSALLS